MADLYLIFNHKVTRHQERDARSSLGVARIIEIPADLKQIWCNIPPDLIELSGYLDPMKQWLASNAKAGDFVLIQGDFGACYMMVNFALEKGLIPVYSTTAREALEDHEGHDTVMTTHRFKHVMYRKYS